MASLYFSYAAMNAGKSTILLQSAHNYRERGMTPLLLTANIDDRNGAGQIASRLGISQPAETFDATSDLFALIKANSSPHVVLLDEAQFLTPDQVWQLARIVDELSIPVLTYGLRTDFRGELFPGSAVLLAIADNIREIRTICWCGKKASMVLRLDENGQPIRTGAQIEIGGNESYVSLCRKHWHAGKTNAD
ncbi:MAG: thymidine kinase [Parvularculaceae bacterium]